MITCPNCSFVWNRLDICPTLPIHDCTKFKGENPPAKSPRETVLAYLAVHPASTIGELIATCEGCKDKLASTVLELVKSGEVIKEGEEPPVYSIPKGVA
jgi:hypothetical protein